MSRRSTCAHAHHTTTRWTLLTLVSVAALLGPAGATLWAQSVELFIADRNLDAVLRFDGQTGAFIDVFADASALDDPVNVEFGPDGNLYVANFGDGDVLRFNGQTGAYMGVFASYGWLEETVEILFDKDYLYALSNDQHLCAVFNATTGSFVREFGDPTMRYPHDMVFGPDGMLYVATESSSQGLMQRWDARTGTLVDYFAPAGTLQLATGVAFGLDGNIYVSDWWGDQVLRYDANTLQLIDIFITPGSGGLNGPLNLQFRPDGLVYIAGSDGIYRFDGTTGAFVDLFIPDGTGGLDYARGFVFRCAPADTDCDGDVDVDDYASWSACLAGPGVTTPPAGCSATEFADRDFDGDSDVDAVDYRAFVAVFSG